MMIKVICEDKELDTGEDGHTLLKLLLAPWSHWTKELQK
uniref:Uncharacterized protein n=1 Tax=Tetranychus urticae TaxID=32264 RepID=T1KZC9_TETUR